MSKGLAAKGLGIDFGDLNSDAKAVLRPLEEGAKADAPRSRSGVAAVVKSVSIQQRLQDANEQLKQFEDAKFIVKLDPARIREGKWKNRDPLSFETPEFKGLKEEIALAGGNIQAVKVRKVGKDEQGDLYEIVYGRRRTRACLELGLKVNAVIDDLSDVQAYLEMHRENLGREDLSPWENGVMYQDALAKGLFPSMRKLAEALDVQVGNMSTAIKLAELPSELIAAFPSPLELQFRWAAPLHAALESDPTRVLSTAEAIRSEGPRPASKEVFDRLVGISRATSSKDIMVARKSVGKWSRDEKGIVTVKFKAGAVSKDQEKRILEYIVSALA